MPKRPRQRRRRSTTSPPTSPHAAASPGKDTGLLASAVEAPGRGQAGGREGRQAADPTPTPPGQLAYTTNKATATAGAVTIEMPNMSGVSHNIAIEPGTGGDQRRRRCSARASFITKGTASVTVTLKPGTYTFFCQAPGHRAAGMFGTLTVK